ncbi:MAG: sensor histidine kinase [Deltaproteobacteria bacterium]|nr:sensor histidine kinase [Deltaproteobacteria bacterium]
MLKLITECHNLDNLPVRDLIDSSGSVSPETPISVLAERFFTEPELDALPLVRDGFPYGLAVRNKILTTLGTRFGFALYARKPISAIADMNPLLVHHDESLNGVLAQAMARDFRDIYDEILVVDEADKYVGLLSVKRLVIEQGNHLAQSIAQRRMALERAAEMQKMNDAKSSFMAHITHELRSPLHAIVGVIELVKMNFSQQKLDEFPKYINLLSTSSANLLAIINNILDLSKIEVGRMDVYSEDFVLGDLLQEVLETCQVLLGDKPLTIELDCAQPQILLSGDRGKVRQILLNLASNAVKYTDRGNITIAAEGGSQLKLSVKDTGIGIRTEDLANLFVAFNQLEDAKTRRYNGSGLGLTITAQLVQLLGGNISVDSTFGIGSRFDVQLPCRQPSQPEENFP